MTIFATASTKIKHCNLKMLDFLTQLSKLDSRVNQTALKKLVESERSNSVHDFFKGSNETLTLYNKFRNIYKLEVDSWPYKDKIGKVLTPEYVAYFFNPNEQTYDLAKNSIAITTQPKAIKREIINPTQRKEDMGFQTIHNSISLSVTDDFARSLNSQNALQRIAQSQAIIRDHNTTNAVLFFQIALRVFDMQAHFKIADTTKQFLLAGEICGVKFEAAHYPTLTGLEYCTLTDLQNENPIYKRFSLDTYLDTLLNSTDAVLKKINQTDTKIDGKNGSSKPFCRESVEDNDPKVLLREYAVNLLNGCALGKIIPTWALRLYIEKRKQLLEARLTHVLAGTEEHLIAQTYLESVRELSELANISTTLEAHHPIFDPCFSLNLNGLNKADIPDVRSRMYTTLFDVVQKANTAESQVIEILKNNFLNTKTYSKLQEAKVCLVWICFRQNFSMLKNLEALFSISASLLLESYRPYDFSQNPTETEFEPYYRVLVEIKKVLNDFQNSEFNFKANLLYFIIRKIKNYTAGQSNELIGAPSIIVPGSLNRKNPTLAKKETKEFNQYLFFKKIKQIAKSNDIQKLESHFIIPVCKIINICPKIFEMNFFASKLLQ